MQALQQPTRTTHPARNPGNGQSLAYRITSEAIGRTVFAGDLATLPINDLRSLYHEVYSARESMLRTVDDFAARLDRTEDHDEDTKEYLESKHHRVSKKLSVYNTFYELIEREVNLRCALDHVTKAKIAIQARLVGLNNAQVNALLDPDNSITKIFAISDYTASPARRKAIAVADRLESLREQMVTTELIHLFKKEFEDSELAEITAEARTNAEQAIDWQQVEAILNEHLPEDNGVLQL